MKDVGLRIRIQRDLREAFVEACRAQDKPAAQVLREFMRAYVARNKEKAYGPAEEPPFEEKVLMPAKAKVRNSKTGRHDI